MKPFLKQGILKRFSSHSRLLVLLLTILTILQSCGYQLRGQAPTSKLPKFEIRGNEPYGDLGIAIRRLIPEAIVDDASETNDKVFTLYLAKETSEKRRVSTAKSALFSEDLITLEIDVEVRQGGELLLKPLHFTASRLFQDDQSQPTGKGLELKLLKSELRDNLARQIVYRLDAMDWQAISNAEPAKKPAAAPSQQASADTNAKAKEPDHAAAP